MLEVPGSKLGEGTQMSGCCVEEGREGREEGAPGLTFVFDEALHLLLHTVVPVGDVHVQGIVTAALPIGPLPPLLIGLRQAGLGFGHHVVD